MNALVLQHGSVPPAPPGLLADWAAARGIPLDVHRADLGEPLPALNGQAFVASLGSPHNPDSPLPEVKAELRFIDRAVDRGIPVLGLCFGGQVLVKVLGGEIEASPKPELGWYAIDSSAPDIVPEGPWLQWHFDRFTLPPGATELARSEHAVQAFVHGPHLGVQFHPESTIEIVRGWAFADRGRVSDAEALLERGRHHAEPAARAAFDLFDAFWARAHD